MKKTIIASIVGGILIFAWQFLSWPLLNLHKAANKYTPNNAAILENLKANLPEEGGYMVPGLPEGSTKEDHEKMMKESNGKPWASIQYHNAAKSTESDMMMNMIRALLVNIIVIMLFSWLIGKMNMAGFGTIFMAAIVIGLIGFLNGVYIGDIWYKLFDIMAYFTDSIVSWALVGIWLGWYLGKKR